jgi:hypothetical protein
MSVGVSPTFLPEQAINLEVFQPPLTPKLTGKGRFSTPGFADDDDAAAWIAPNRRSLTPGHFEWLTTIARFPPRRSVHGLA